VAIPPRKWAGILNRVLPADLSVLDSRRVSNEFHSRFSAQDRFYRYRILLRSPDPIRSRFTYFYHSDLNVDRMNEGASALIGDHDFRAFTEELDPGVENTRRTLSQFQVRRFRDEVWVDVVGTAFLRGMMRRMAGALYEVGRGHRSVEEVSRLLDPEERNRLHWPVVLPARGLCLMRVRYGRHPRDFRV
jgi:tRNA pseudouridine38-40 synthase